MLRSPFLALVAVVVAACSPSFSAPVRTFTTPIANTLGTICWRQVDTSGAPAIRTAAFRADATYDASLLAVTERVRMRVYGRADAPERECTSHEASDVPLSDEFELEREASQPIEVGGAGYGEDLATLVRGGTFWIGATAAGNVGAGEEVEFENGRITVGF